MINIEQQFDDIYSRYYHVILAFARSKGLVLHVAEEVADEVFTRLWTRRDECKFNNPNDDVNENMLRSWLYRAAEYVMFEAKRTIKDTENLEECINEVTDNDNINECIEDIGYDEYLAQIEKELPERQREIFHIMFVEKLNYEDAKKRLNLKDSSLRSAISRMRERLRPYIDKLIGYNKNK